MLNRIAQIIFYLLDPVFRNFVNSKHRGPGDPVRTGEKIIGVLQRENSSPLTKRGKK